MSLTDFVHYERDAIDELADKPICKLKTLFGSSMRCPPMTNHYGTVGMAFDYAMRMLIHRQNVEITQKRRLVAWNGIGRGKRRREFMERLEEKENEVLAGQLAVENILSDYIVCAKLETVFRSGRNVPDTEIFGVDQGDVEDLRQLVETIPVGLFKAKVQCILNPIFGKSSGDVGGADADIILDSLLLDIKTTKEFKFRREYWRQLIGYYALNMREGNMYGEMKELGLYFSRYGVLYKFPAPVLKDDEEYELSGLECFDIAIEDYQEAIGLTIN